MSIETATEVGVATFESIVEAMDFRLACEHDAHETSVHHSGDAAWFCTELCGNADCGEAAGLTCDAFHIAAVSLFEGTECPWCDDGVISYSWVKL